MNMRWGRNVARMEDMRSVYKILVGRPWVKIPLEMPRCRLEENVKSIVYRYTDGGNSLDSAGSS
jgi:hypothetical protein